MITITKDIKPKDIEAKVISTYVSMYPNIDSDIAKDKQQCQKIFNRLTDLWYKKLSEGNTTEAYSLYNDDYYFTDLLLCYRKYSRIGIRNLSKLSYLNPSVIVDLGCGLGLSTSLLKTYYKEAIIYGTNLENTKQWKYASSMAITNGWYLIDDISTIKYSTQNTLIFASEYFEHFENPIAHLDYIINILTPKYIAVGNAFSAVALGHFNDRYKIGNLQLSSRQISKLFNNKMKDYGYTIAHRFYNSKPVLWMKNN